MDVWQEEITVRFGSVDSSDRLTLGAAFGFFQEAAISHAAVLGVGRDALNENGQAWILSRFSVFFEQRPGYGETVTVRTWPRGQEKLFALRDYEILDHSGKALVRGRSGWLILDIVNRRPLRTREFIEKLPLNQGLDALLSGPLGLAPCESLIPSGERLAAYSDIDYYGHVNNVRYVQWIQDMCPVDKLNGASQLRLDINYLNEIRPGEKVELLSASLDGHSGADYPSLPKEAFAYEGRRSSDPERTAFRAELRLGD